MIGFNLTDDNKSFYYAYPETAKEHTLRSLIDYEQKIEANKPEILRKFEEIEEEEDRKAYLDLLGPKELERATISYYMREIQFFTNMRLEHLPLLPVNNKEGIDIFGLRNLIRRSFLETKAEEISSFRFKGVTYYLPPSPPNLFDPSKKDYMRGAKIGEYSTASELLRAYRLMEKGSIEGLLNVIAVLCRRKGEELPVYPDEQTKFIKERAELFKDLDYQTALNVGFFLSKPEKLYQTASQFLKDLKEDRRAKYQKNTAFI